VAYNNFEFCCGAREVGNFYQTADMIRDNIEDAIAGALSDDRGALIATTIAEQRVAIRELRRAKFKVVAEFPNPNTGGTLVTLWFKNLHEITRRSRKGHS
jgi:hypothetical protein